MKLFILKADNSKEMNKISEDLSQNKFKITQQEKHYILECSPKLIFDFSSNNFLA